MRNSSKFNYDYFAKYFKKGLNIFIFITFIILLVVSLSGFKKKGYNLFVEFNNAHRIKKGTNVTLQGVLVGYVNSISIKSNKVIILININSLNTLILRNSVVEANQIGLFNEVVIDIIQSNQYQGNYIINPKSVECINSPFVCSNFYLKGYKGLNYDDLVRATTRISQRFDDPRFFALFYVLLQNFVDISDEVFYFTNYFSYLIYLFVDLVTRFL